MDRRGRVGLSLSAFLLVAAPAIALRPNTSDVCGTCHKDIYRVWRESRHAKAMEDPFFLDSFRDTESRVGVAKSRVCLECHAPMARLGGDTQLERKVSWEGVTCDYCHSLVAVRMTDSGPRTEVEVGNVKRGPIRNAASSGHDVAHSELHVQSVVCAPCHEYSNRDGVSIMTTHTEWKASSAAARGETCQTCHMAITRANVVDPRIKRNTGAEVNLHEMPGAHSIEQLLTALKVSVIPVRGPEAIDIEVIVSNQGAGHAVPTGMPGRRIMLQVGATKRGGDSFEDQRVYGKLFVSSSGADVVHVADYFLGNIRMKSDTRIKVDEDRRETFRFPVRADEDATLDVRLIYEHMPRGRGLEGERFTFYADSRLLRAQP